MNNRRSIIYTLVLVFCLFLGINTKAYADTQSSDEVHGVSIDFSTATDAELEEAIISIRAEQRRRLNTKIVLSDEMLDIKLGGSKTLSAYVEDLPTDVSASSFSWVSSDEDIATCRNVTIKAMRQGKTIIFLKS